MPRNTITITFDSDRPLTHTEQEALLVQIELALTEPQDNIHDAHGTVIDTEAADWMLTEPFDMEAIFPVL